MIDTSKWKEFSLVDYFDIEAGIYHYPDEYDEGTTPYVSATNENNGIGQYISLSPDFEGNKIVTGKVGCTAFYESEPFCATSDVNVFTPKFDMSANVGIFLVTLINFNENYKWAYGRQCRVGNSKKIKILLPAAPTGEPDWQYMEDFMGDLHSKPITTSVKSSHIPLETEKWKEFRVGDLISAMYKAKAHTKEEFDISFIGNTNPVKPYVTRTELNNAVDAMIIDKNIVGIENGNAIVIGDTTATISYQPEPFVCGDHIVIIRADWLTPYTGMFFISILKKEHFRYSYGRAFTMDLIANTFVKLPATPTGEPDWQYMEDYIKSLPYVDKLGVFVERNVHQRKCKKNA